MELSGRVALVTGASRGVGAATARALARAGCDVACAARSTTASPGRVEGTLEETVEAVRALGRRGLAVPTNLTSDAAVTAMVETTRAHFGRVDVLVNNAGVVDFSDLDIDLARFDRSMAVNLRAPLIATRAVAPLMREAGGGAILNISSLAAILPQPGSLSYGIAKAGLERLTMETARILADDGVAVNCLRIDVAVASEGFTANTPDLDHSGWEAPDAVAEAIVWMLRRPTGYTSRIESLHELRGRLGIGLANDPADPTPPTHLVAGVGADERASASEWSA